MQNTNNLNIILKEVNKAPKTITLVGSLKDQLLMIRKFIGGQVQTSYLCHREKGVDKTLIILHALRTGDLKYSLYDIKGTAVILKYNKQGQFEGLSSEEIPSLLEKLSQAPYYGEPLFDLGEITITPSALEILGEQGAFRLLDKHCHGDWGVAEEDSVLLNDEAIKSKDMILSVYMTNNNKFFVITEYQHTHTTIMLAEEY